MKQKGIGFFTEFKAFISRGNVIDLAVGIIMGTAFTAIVNSLVKDIVMPVIGFLISGVDFSNLKIILRPAGDGIEEVAIAYGGFFQQLISFVVIAFVVFCMVKGINNLRKKEKAAAPAEEKKEDVVPDDVALLREIRDLLKRQ